MNVGKPLPPQAEGLRESHNHPADASSSSGIPGDVSNNSGQAHLQQMAGERSTARRLLGMMGINSQPEKHRWAPGQQFILNGNSSDWVIRSAVKTHRNERKIPDCNIFSMANLPGSNALAQLTLDSRLVLHGHGSLTRFYYMDSNGNNVGATARALAAFLHSAGLRAVGVLKFKACDLGRGAFLEDLVHELEHRGVSIGYASAPTGIHISTQKPISINNHRFNIHVIPFIPPKTVNHPLKPEKYGLNTVKGNVPGLKFPGTRYV